MNLDTAPYPWQLAVARDLQRKLIDTVFEPKEAQALVRDAGVPHAAKINWSQDINAVWRDILQRAAAEGCLRSLLQHIVAAGTMSASTRQFIAELLDDRTPEAEPGPALVGAHGERPVPLVTRDEALLFGDDLTESVGEIPNLLVSIALVMQARRAVCRMHVHATDGQAYYGTGTLLPGSRILTNHHVLCPNNKIAASVVAEFDYELDDNGQSVRSTRVMCDIKNITSDAAEDWGTIALAEVPPASALPFDLAANYAVARPGDRAFIIQHPAGRPKRLGFVRNRVSTVEPQQVFYLTDTEGGTSGSLVFNAAGKAIALHRVGGVPQKLVGTVPLKNNAGVRIDLVVDAIAKADAAAAGASVEGRP